MVYIVIPTYKPNDTLNDSLASLQAQTLPKPAFQVVIVLNGCGEPYLSDCKDTIAAFPDLNIHFIYTEKAGVSGARNLALDYISTDIAPTLPNYVTFLDDDDWFSPEYLKVMLETASTDIITVALMQDYDEENGNTCDGYSARYWKRFRDKGFADFYEGRGLLSTVGAKFVPWEVIGNRRFDVSFPLGEDALFMTSLTDRIKGIKLTTTESAVYYRRLRSTSASRVKRPFFVLLWIVIRLCLAYFFMWLRHPFSYPFKLLMGRIAVTPVKWFFWTAPR